MTKSSTQKDHVIIVGGGPIGMYLSIMLEKQGLQVTVIEPRVGQFTRPGYLTQENFDHVQQKLQTRIWDSSRKGKIRNFEKSLYQYALGKKIHFIKAKFVRVDNVDGKAGIVIQDSTQEELFVPCDYVIDCTGTHRAVVTDINNRVSPPPFGISKVETNIPVRHQMIAYVKINPTDQSNLDFRNPSVTELSKNLESLIALRAMGWTDVDFPHLYGTTFGENKVCLYLECPPNLSIDQQDEWLNLMISCKRFDHSKPVIYEHIPVTEGKRKPYFLQFQVDPVKLDKHAISLPGYPAIMVAGDASIEFNHRLAHGLLDGLKRADVLLRCLDIIDGKIFNFDPEDYNNLIKPEVNSHIESLHQLYILLRDNSRDYIYDAYVKMIVNSGDQPNLTGLKDVITEIKARHAFYEGSKLFKEKSNMAGNLTLPSTPEAVSRRLGDLQEMVNHLEQAFHHLPPSRSHDREETLRLLLAVANCMKDCGNALYKANDYKQAITAYRQSIKIYELIETDQQYALSQILLKSNLVNALRQAKHYPDAVEEGISALNNLPSDPCFSVFHNKIVFHMVHAVCAMIDSNTLGQDSLLMLKVYNRLSAERERISPNYREKLSEFFSKIETFCQSSSSLRHLNRFFGTCRDEGQSQPETSSLISHDLASRLG